MPLTDKLTATLVKQETHHLLCISIAFQSVINALFIRHVIYIVNTVQVHDALGLSSGLSDVVRLIIGVGISIDGTIKISNTSAKRIVEVCLTTVFALRAVLTSKVTGTVAKHVQIGQRILILALTLTDVSLSNHQHIFSRTGSDGITATELRVVTVTRTVAPLRDSHTAVMRIQGIIVTCTLILVHIPVERLIGIVAYESMSVAQLTVLQHIKLVALTIKIREALVARLVDDILDTRSATDEATLISHSTIGEISSLSSIPLWSGTTAVTIIHSDE